MPTPRLNFWANWLTIGAIILLLDGLTTFLLAEVYATTGYDLLFGAGSHQALPPEAISWMRGLLGVAAGMACAAGTSRSSGEDAAA